MTRALNIYFDDQQVNEHMLRRWRSEVRAEIIAGDSSRFEFYQWCGSMLRKLTRKDPDDWEAALDRMEPEQVKQDRARHTGSRNVAGSRPSKPVGLFG